MPQQEATAKRSPCTQSQEPRLPQLERLHAATKTQYSKTTNSLRKEQADALFLVLKNRKKNPLQALGVVMSAWWPLPGRAAGVGGGGRRKVGGKADQ